MGISFHWSWLAVFSCLLSMGEVRGDCTKNNLEIEGGNYTLSSELQTGSVLAYSCLEGFYPHPARIRECQPNGRWNPPPKKYSPQRCRMVECPDPTVMQHGDVLPPQERYYVGNVTTFECYSGYTMRGSHRRECLNNGKWSGRTTICSRDSDVACADPGNPPGTTRTGNQFGIDDKVTYVCNGDLLLVGNKERVCLESGQWTGQEPTCYYQHTYDTPREVSEAFGSAITQSLSTLEPSEDTQVGKKIRISKNGTLNFYIAVDISDSIAKEHITDAKDAVSKLITKISSFSVSPNYEIVFFSSKIIEVVKIVDFFSGVVTGSSIKKALDDFTTDDKPSGTNLNQVFKTFWERMSFIKERVGDEAFKEHRHVFLIFTDGAYNMGGSPEPTLARIKSLVNMNSTSEQDMKSREEHLDVYVFGIGTQILDEDLQKLTSQREDKHYFRMKDIRNLQKTFDEIIDEENVKGLCGLHREYETADKDSTRKMYPWYAFITVQNGGSPKKCLGSLVTSKFILTAAHCFTFGDLPEHVSVEIDDGKSRVRPVKSFKLHPNYNIHAKVDQGVAEFYDYDVALIELETDIEFSVSVRPICIPCTQETSNALRLVGASTCKQQEEILLKNQRDTLNFLTKIKNTVDIKNVHAKLGENRPDCIRHALNAPGITTNNVSVAVTNNFLCTGGRSPYRDHISCTGDSGGAVFKNYDHRTIQVALVSWGTENVCTGGGVVESREKSRDFHLNLFRVVPFLKSILGDDTQDAYTPLTFLSN